MKTDVVLAGVGGQGVLSVAALIASVARQERLSVKQGEVHGMAQRGGAVLATLRMADGPIHSDLIPMGSADALLSMEPLEALRYVRYLAPGGTLVSSIDPCMNIPDYPDIQTIVAELQRWPNLVLVEAESLAREAGTLRASNVVMVGAAAHLLPVSAETIEAHIRTRFAAKGERTIEVNLSAFRAGREAVACQPQ